MEGVIRFSSYTLGDYEGLVPALNFDTPAGAMWMDTRPGNSDPDAIRHQSHQRHDV